MIYDSLFDLIRGRYGVDAVSGPVGTTQVIGEAAQAGGATLLYLIAVITINLGVFNLFPLPPLDGGHVVYTLYEMVFRRPVPERVAAALDSGFSLLLFGFLIFITFKDIIGLF
jgi:regulator of sigma E protease